MLTSRKKRPLDRASATRDAKLIVIASEGEKTEVIYFEMFQSTRLKIRLINSEGGRSSPAHIMENMQSYIDSYEIGGSDELWLVLDRDAWHPRMISQVATLCKQKQVRLAVSNPCFELWLAHHFDEVLPKPLDCANLQNHLRLCMESYNKSSYNAGCLLVFVNRAIENAKKLDKNPNNRWPHPVGTRVHELASSILASI